MRAEESGHTRPLAVARIGIGLCLLDQSYRFARELAGGWMGDRFRWPALPGVLVAPRPVFVAFAVALPLLALAIVAGRLPRPALLASAAIHLYALLADRLTFHHHRYALSLFAALLAFAPCERALVLGGRPRDPIGPLWAQRLAQAQIAILYLASGGSKLLDPDWRGGRVVADGVTRFTAAAIARGAPAGVVHALTRVEVARALAIAAIAVELFLAFGLWSRRARPIALWLGTLFHLAIELATTVAIFSWLMLAMYALFATPDAGARTLRYDPARRWHAIAAAAARALDWLDRFTLVAEPGSRFTVIDRDGRSAPAAAGLARALPLLFPLWLPLAVVARALHGVKDA